MKRFFLALLFLAATVVAYGQTTVRGVVRDASGQPVVGAGILQAGSTTNGVVSDLDGAFVISVPSTATLEVSCVGYVTKQVAVDGQTRLTIVLEEDAEMLEDVVVVAFGKMKREAFTGSAGVMKSEELAKAQVTNATQALAGRVAGVQINNTSGQLGSSPSITIRGIGSYSSDTSPLIVVDGMPYDGDLNLINSADIESMTVLKDAASNALYGARGANGVIMITTKRGQAGDAKVTFDAKWGLNTNALQLYDTVDTQQFYETYYKTIYNQAILDGASAADAHAKANAYVQGSSTGPGYMVYTVPRGEDFILEGGTMNPKASLGAFHVYDGQTFWLQPDDWEKEGLQNGFRQEYNVSVTGSVASKVNYFASLGYLDQTGIQEGSDQDRLTARLSADYQAKPWLKVGGNFNYTKYKYHNTSEGTLNAGFIWQTIKTQAPVYPVWLRDGNGNVMIDRWGEPRFDFAQSYDLNRAGGTGGNTIFGNKYQSSGTDGNAFTVSGFADFKLMDGLVFTVNASAYDYDRRYTYTDSPFVDYYTNSSDNGYLYKSSTRTYTYNTQQLLNYNKTFDKHEVSALLGHEYYNYKYEYMDVAGKNFGIDNATELGQVLEVDPNPSSASSSYNVEGFFSRAMYNYDGRYYLSGSYRRDASSRFAKNHRWGNFWSVGGAWVITKEPWFDSSWIDFLKFKASVGSQGNDNIGSYMYVNTRTIVDAGGEPSYPRRQSGTEDITWETNTNWNTGFDFELFNRRLTGSLDYFYRVTSDMLFEIEVPPTYATGSYWTNMGDIRNRGVELDLHWAAVQKKNFSWNIDFNASHVRDRILRLPDDLKVNDVDGHGGFVNEDGSFISKYRYYVGEGLPLYTWYLREYAGVDKETGEALYYKDEVDADGNPTGNKVTTNNADQGTYYLNANAMPDLYGGLGMSFQLYGFDLSFNLTWQLGGKAYDYAYQVIMHNGSGNQIGTTWHKDILRAWTPTNTDTDVPRLNQSDVYTSSRSDRFLVDASYLNFQNVNIGYTLPSRVTRRMGISNLRLYASAENLFYLSARRGFDPRYSLAGYNNMSSYNPIRTVSGGISLTF